MILGIVALVAFVAVTSACSGEKPRAPAPGPGSGSAAGNGAAVTAKAAAVAEPIALPPEATQLPGTIVFAGSRLARLAGGQLTTFADVGADVFPSRWALPDGRIVGIASRGDGEPGGEQLVLIGPAQQVTRIGTAVTQVRDPAVDPAGKWIVYEANVEGHSELYRLELATGEVTRLTNNPQGNFRPAVLGTDAIVFASSRDGDSEIYRASGKGERVQRLTAFHRDDWEPTPSPDGKTLAFVSDREGRPRIFLMSPDGTHQRRLTGRTEPDVDEVAPVWSPDGKSLAYLVEAPGKAQVWVREVATGRERLVTPAGARDGDAAFSPDGAWLAVARTHARDPELWVIPLAAGASPQGALRLAAGRLPRWF